MRATAKSFSGSVVFRPKRQRPIFQDRRCLIGAVPLLADRPCTLTVMPTDDRLVAAPEVEAGAATWRLVERWERLHAGRSALGAASALVSLRAALG